MHQKIKKLKYFSILKNSNTHNILNLKFWFLNTECIEVAASDNLQVIGCECLSAKINYLLSLTWFKLRPLIFQKKNQSKKTLIHTAKCRDQVVVRYVFKLVRDYRSYVLKANLKFISLPLQIKNLSEKITRKICKSFEYEFPTGFWKNILLPWHILPYKNT